MEFGLEGMLELLGLSQGVAAKLLALRDGINLCLSLNLPTVEV